MLASRVLFNRSHHLHPRSVDRLTRRRFPHWLWIIPAGAVAYGWWTWPDYYDRISEFFRSPRLRSPLTVICNTWALAGARLGSELLEIRVRRLEDKVQELETEEEMTKSELSHLHQLLINTTWVCRPSQLGDSRSFERARQADPRDLPSRV